MKKFNANVRKKELHKIWSLVIRNRDGFYCKWCSFEGKLNFNKLHHAHHIVSQSLCGSYGRFEEENGMTLCFHCHIDRIKSQPDEYIVFRDNYLKKRNINYFELKQKYSENRIKFDEEFYNKKKQELINLLDNLI